MPHLLVCFVLVACTSSLTEAATYYLGQSDPADPDTNVLRILVLLPHQKNGYNFPFGLEMSGAAVLSAFQQISEDGLLSKVSLKADYADSGCNGVTGIGRAFHMLSVRNYSAIIGPQCSSVCAAVGRLASFLNIPCYSGVCQDVEMSNKKEFKTLTRLLASFEMTGFAVSELLLTFDWRRAGILAERRTDIIWLLTRNGLHHSFGVSNITVAMSTLLFDDTDLEKVLLETANVSRVIILLMNAGPFREAMRLAIRHGLTDGDYVFVCVTYYKQTKIFGNFNWQQGDPDDDKIREAYKSVFFLSYYNRDDLDIYRKFLNSVKRGSANYFGYHYGVNEEVPYPAANLYEATYLFAVAVNETLTRRQDIRNGTLLAQRLWGRTYGSVTGGVTLNENGDREQDYMLRHLQSEQTGNVELIGTYISRNNTLNIIPEKITWPGGRPTPPKDTPPCGYDGELCIEAESTKFRTVVTIFASSLSAIIVIGTVSSVLIFRKLKWEKEVGEMKWKANHSDIVMQDARNTASGVTFSLVSLRSGRSGRSSANGNYHYTTTGIYKGLVVALKASKHVTQVDLTNKTFLQEMKQLYDLSHPNVVKMMGATVEVPDIYLLTEYCPKGSLQDLLENDDVTLDMAFKYSLMNDIVKGLYYLHTSFVKCHGNLKSSNCVVDSRFVVKLMDFAPASWHIGLVSRSKDLLWTAPELLTDIGRKISKNPASDIYAFGIILQEIMLREGPFYRLDCTLESDDIINRVRHREIPPFRPSVLKSAIPTGIEDLMTQCWADDPTIRPTTEVVLKNLKRVVGSSVKGSLMDNLLLRMEQYAKNLEGLVSERTGKYLEEKKRVEELLHRLLPKSVAEELQTSGFVQPRTHESVTVYFSDIVEFTTLCSQSSPMQVVTMLNDLYTMFDEIIAQYDVYKVETIGDAYMAVSGLPKENKRHASEIAKMALKLRSCIKTFRIRHHPDRELYLRIGLHSGSCVAGVVGLTMPRYCLFGDTINTAARMESNGEALKIHMSSETCCLLRDAGGFVIDERGEINIKGKGAMRTYWLVSDV